MNVDKDKFDALLGKLMQTPPQPAKSIETQGKAGKIVPPISPQSTPPGKARTHPGPAFVSSSQAGLHPENEHHFSSNGELSKLKMSHRRGAPQFSVKHAPPPRFRILLFPQADRSQPGRAGYFIWIRYSLVESSHILGQPAVVPGFKCRRGLQVLCFEDFSFEIPQNSRLT